MRRQSLKQLISGSLFLALVVNLIAPSVARAASLNGISIYPRGQSSSSQPWFNYLLGAGHQTTSMVTIANSSSQTQTLLVYPVDAVISSNNAFAMAPSYSPRTDVGAWISLPLSQLILQPHSSRTIPFNLSIPVNATVGPHYGGIVVQPATATTTNVTGNNQVTVVSRLGVRVYETVPGNQQSKLAILSAKAQQQGQQLIYDLTIKNDGNTAIAPSGQMEITNLTSKLIADKNITTGSALSPGATSQIIVSLPLGSDWPERYTAHFALQYGSNSLLYKQVSAWVSSWIVKVFAVIDGLVILAVIIFWRRRIA